MPDENNFQGSNYYWDIKTKIPEVTQNWEIFVCVFSNSSQGEERPGAFRKYLRRV